MRSSGEWFLEVEPGNLYGDFEITDSTLILSNNTEWDSWWGGDTDWWDWFFGFWSWEQDDFRSCGWNITECYDSEAAANEQARICGNLTIIKQVINMLVKADDMIARIAYSDAENVTVLNESYEDEYTYYMKWSKRYWWRGYDNYKKGRPHRAIDDFQMAWKYSVLAIKWALKGAVDPEPSEDDFENPCEDCYVDSNCTEGCNNETSECEKVISQPWWMYWYFMYCNECHFTNCPYDQCSWKD